MTQLRPATGPSLRFDTGLHPTFLFMVFGLAVLAWWLPLGVRDLVQPDEGRYAEIGREMLASGDWLSPRLNGILYFEKPPLVYWATALAMWLFGVNEFAARFWPALTGMATVIAMAWVIGARDGQRTGLLSTAVLMASLWWIGNSHFLNLDMSLSCFVTLAMLAYVHARHEQATVAQRRVRMRLAWLALALGVMSKGPIGIVIPAMALGATVLIERDPSLLKGMRWVEGTLIMLGVCAPWFIAMELRHPGFLDFFFVHEHLQRYATSAARRPGGWGYFIPVLAAGVLPWIGLLPGALRAGWTGLQARRPGSLRVERLALAWALTIFLFFSASHSKLPSYILPMFAPLALLIARHAQAIPMRALRRHLMGIVIVLCVAVLAVAVASSTVVATLRTSVAAEAVASFRGWLVGSVVLLAAATLGWLLLQRKQDRLRDLLLFSLAWLIAIQVATSAFQILVKDRSMKQMVATVSGQLDSRRPFYSVQAYDQALPFYLRRPVTLVGYVDEFGPGLQREPGHALATLDEFTQAWPGQPGAAALMNNDTYEALRAKGLPMKLVWQDRRRVVVLSR